MAKSDDHHSNQTTKINIPRVDTYKLHFRAFPLKVGPVAIGAHMYWLITDKDLNPQLEYHGMAVDSESPYKPITVSFGGLTKVFKYIHNKGLTFEGSKVPECHSLYEPNQLSREIGEVKVENVIKQFENIGSIWNSKDTPYNPLTTEAERGTNSNTVTYTLGSFAGVNLQQMTPFPHLPTPGLFDISSDLILNDTPIPLAGNNPDNFVNDYPT